MSAARANRDRRAEATTYAAIQAALVLAELTLAKREAEAAWSAHGFSHVTVEQRMARTNIKRALGLKRRPAFIPQDDGSLLMSVRGRVFSVDPYGLVAERMAAGWVRREALDA